MSVEKTKQLRIAKLEKMLKENNNDLFVKYALALEYISLNDFLLGEAFLREIIETDVNYVAAYYQLGMLNIHLNFEEKALEILQKGLKVATLQKESLKTINEFRSAIDEIMY